MTQRDFYNAIIKADVAQELKDYASAQVQALNNKNSARNVKTRAKKDAVNAPLLAQINALLADGKTHTCAEISAYTGANSPKIAALVKPFVDNGTIVKETVKNGKNRAIAYRNAVQVEEKGD
jgi:hypothetical protein